MARATSGGRRTVETSAGPIELAIRYWDASVAQFVFHVDADTARSLVAGLQLEPLEIRPGRSLAGLAFYEYRRTSVGPYNEVGLAIPCAPGAAALRTARMARELLRPVRRRRFGFAIVDLPVTSEIAKAAGWEIWGYPKFVTELPIEFGASSFTGRIVDPDEGSMIADMDGSLGPGFPLPTIDLVTYTLHKGTCWRTVADVRGMLRAHRGAGLQLSIGPSPHPMANHLRALNLHHARPIVALVSHRWRSLLYAGAPA